MAEAQLGELTGLVNALSTVKGSKTKETRKTDISDEGVMELVNSVLRGPGGVASIGSAARKSGLFNDTVSEDRLTDLMSRTAVNAELARSPTTTTTETPGVGIGGLVGPLLVSSTLSSLMKGETPFAGTIDKLFGNSTIAGGAPVVEGTPAVSNIADELAAAGTDFGAGANAGTSAASAVNATGATGATGAGGSALGSAGSFIGQNALGLGLPLFGGLLAGDDADDPLNLALSAASGFATMGPIGLLAAPAASLLGGSLGDSGIGKAISKAFSGIGDFVSDIF